MAEDFLVWRLGLLCVFGVSVIGGGGGDVFCYPCCERGGRGEEFDGVGDALNWIAVAGVDAGEEGGARGEVGFVAGTNDCGHFYG